MVSIPLRGLGLFRRLLPWPTKSSRRMRFNPLAGIRAFQTNKNKALIRGVGARFNPLAGIRAFQTQVIPQLQAQMVGVSIPLRGLGLFRRPLQPANRGQRSTFQSPCGD